MSESHTVTNAMRRGELSEDEAYFVLRFAGRRGYGDAIRRMTPWTKRLRKKFLWIGGWEVPELMQWDLGKPAWEPRREDGRWRPAYPVTLLDTLTVFGGWWQLACFGGCLVWAFNQGDGCYWSPDGTPGHPKARRILGRRRRQ